MNQPVDSLAECSWCGYAIPRHDPDCPKRRAFEPPRECVVCGQPLTPEGRCPRPQETACTMTDEGPECAMLYCSQPAEDGSDYCPPHRHGVYRERDERTAATTVAALYVEKDGAYYGLPGVDPWDEERDARLYVGPWPVVAHPPCKHWSQMSHCRPEIERGADHGCFEAALDCVREYGGVLEHPAHTHAWEWFDLPEPIMEGWSKAIWDEGWVCEVDQRWYGHEANKPTWLYYVGASEPPELRWGRAPAGDKTVGRSYGQGRSHLRARTPLPFRDVLLDMARSAGKVAA